MMRPEAMKQALEKALWETCLTSKKNHDQIGLLNQRRDKVVEILERARATKNSMATSQYEVAMKDLSQFRKDFSSLQKQMSVDKRVVNDFIHHQQQVTEALENQEQQSTQLSSEMQQETEMEERVFQDNAKFLHTQLLTLGSALNKQRELMDAYQAQLQEQEMMLKFYRDKFERHATEKYELYKLSDLQRMLQQIKRQLAGIFCGPELTEVGYRAINLDALLRVVRANAE